MLQTFLLDSNAKTFVRCSNRSDIQKANFNKLQLTIKAGYAIMETTRWTVAQLFMCCIRWFHLWNSNEDGQYRHGAFHGQHFYICFSCCISRDLPKVTLDSPYRMFSNLLNMLNVSSCIISIKLQRLVFKMQINWVHFTALLVENILHNNFTVSNDINWKLVQ